VLCLSCACLCSGDLLDPSFEDELLLKGEMMLHLGRGKPLCHVGVEILSLSASCHVGIATCRLSASCYSNPKQSRTRPCRGPDCARHLAECCARTGYVS
jgi:hypothetical protein